MWKKRLLSRFKWISSIALLASTVGSAAVKPVALAISPTNPLLFGKNSRQSLLVLASYSDGTRRSAGNRLHVRRRLFPFWLMTRSSTLPR